MSLAERLARGKSPTRELTLQNTDAKPTVFQPDANRDRRPIWVRRNVRKNDRDAVADLTPLPYDG